MSPQELDNFLRDLPRNGTLVRDRGYRQIWKFAFQDRGYFLKFYPRRGNRLKRLLRGNPAHREFTRLQAMQRGGVPAPRATAQLLGFRLGGQIGDAVIIEAIERATPLDRYVSDFVRKAEEIPNRHALGRAVLELVRKLGEAKLGHNDLHLGNMLLRDGKIYLLDGYAVRLGGLKMADVMRLGHSVRTLATRTELQRLWDELGPGGRMPPENPESPRQWRKLIERSWGENEYFGGFRAGAWRGHFFKRFKFPRRWAPASGLQITAEDWQRNWPELLRKIEADQLTVIKRGPSGDVLAGETMIGGKLVPIIVKRPFKRYWRRYLNEIGRGGRASRAWRKSWELVARDIPTAWPLLVMQKRILGYVTDSIIVFEQVAGPTLASAELDSMTADHREMLLRRTGGVLRKIDQLGLGHYDAKANNWIVQDDEKLGPRPVLVDVDGIRFRRWPALGISRLLRSMRDHPQYTPEDSLSLCQGYAPFSRSEIEQEA